MPDGTGANGGSMDLILNVESRQAFLSPEHTGLAGLEMRCLTRQDVSRRWDEAM